MSKNKKAYCIAAKMLVVILWQLPLATNAQQPDSLAVLKQFVNICNSYKKLPLHASIAIHNTTDVESDNPQDTARYNMEFFMQATGAYIKTAGVQQVINDSLALFIDDKLRRIVLYPNPGQLKEQLNKAAGLLLKDSSLQKLADNYRVLPMPAYDDDRQTGRIKIETRGTLTGTNIPKAAIEILYDKNNNQPLKVIQLRRKIIPVDSMAYAGLQNNSLYKNKLVKPGKGYFFVIKELSTEFNFNLVDYENVKLPLRVEDCVIKLKTGQYGLTKDYEAFVLSVN